MPFRKSKPWGNTKPTVGYGIDFGDPINSQIDGCWLANENAGNKLTDISRGNNGTFTSGPTWGNGRFGKAINLPASGSAYVNLAKTNYPVPVSAASIAAWVNVNAATSIYSPILTRTYAGTHTSPYHVFKLGANRFGSADKFNCEISTTSVNDQSTPAPSTYAYGVWYFVVATYDGANVRLYQNGVLVATQATTGNFIYGSGGFIRFGANAGGAENFYGLIDNVRFYSNRALTASEVRRLYTEPFAGIITPRRRIISQAAAAGGVFTPYYWQQHIAGGMHGESA